MKPVILIGVDHNFVAQGKPHEEVISQGEDLNHFHTNYFSKGIKWHLPDLLGSEKFYKIAYAHFWINNRQIIDATVNGNCTIFPKENYKNIFIANVNDDGERYLFQVSFIKNILPFSEYRIFFNHTLIP